MKRKPKYFDYQKFGEIIDKLMTEYEQILRPDEVAAFNFQFMEKYKVDYVQRCKDG